MMKRKHMISLALGMLLFLFGCSKAPAEDGLESDAEEEAVAYYTDYYTDVPAIVTDFPELSEADLPDFSAVTDWQQARAGEFCVTDDSLYLYDLIKREDELGSHTQNGIIGIDREGNRTRICPESTCTVDTVCNHIVLMFEAMLPYENELYICGKPYLDEGFYENLCLMRYDLTTRAYEKYAELPLRDSGELYWCGDYLFVYALTAENIATVYCFDLVHDMGYRYIFYAKANGPSFSGVLEGYLVMHDKQYLYLLDGGGEIVQTFAHGGESISPKIIDRTLYYQRNLDGERALYRYDTNSNTATLLLENVNGFDGMGDTLYFFRDEVVPGLRFLSPYRDENDQLAWQEEDYPVLNGTVIDTYSLTTGETATYMTFPEEQFASGLLSVSPFGMLYSYFSATDMPQKQYFPETYMVRDMETGEEWVLAERWIGNGRSYGR